MDLWMERGRHEGSREGGHDRTARRAVITSIAAGDQDHAPTIQWKVDRGCRTRACRGVPLISGALGAPLAAAVRERSDRYAASTHLVCDVLAQRARQVTEAAPLSMRL